MKKAKKINPDKLAEEWVFSESFGGIPQDVDLTKNIGSPSSGKKKDPVSVPKKEGKGICRKWKLFVFGILDSR